MARAKAQFDTSRLSVEELQYAETELIKHIQSQEFSISDLVVNRSLKKSSFRFSS